MITKPNTGRKRAQRMFPITPDDACDVCGGIKTLQRHHKDHDTSNNAPENIALLCADCHAIEHVKLAPAQCEICGVTFQPKRKRRSTLCGSADCLKEKGRLSAARRWA